MPWLSPLTGLKWPEGKDFESNTPLIWQESDRLIGQSMITVSAIDVTDRDKKFPAPGLNQRPVVQLANGELHKWDGRQWLIFDVSPQTGAFAMYAVDPESPSTLNPMTVDPDSSGDGGGQVWWQRDGHHVDWQITTVFGADSNMGWTNGWFVWLTPFVSKWTSIAGKNIGPATVRGTAQVGNKAYPLGVSWTDPTHAVAIDPTGTRVGRSNWAWSGGDWITIGGRSRMSGLI